MRGAPTLPFALQYQTPYTVYRKVKGNLDYFPQGKNLYKYLFEITFAIWENFNNTHAFIYCDLWPYVWLVFKSGF